MSLDLFDQPAAGEYELGNAFHYPLTASLPFPATEQIVLSLEVRTTYLDDPEHPYGGLTGFFAFGVSLRTRTLAFAVKKDGTVYWRMDALMSIEMPLEEGEEVPRIYVGFEPVAYGTFNAGAFYNAVACTVELRWTPQGVVWVQRNPLAMTNVEIELPDALPYAGGDGTIQLEANSQGGFFELLSFDLQGGTFDVPLFWTNFVNSYEIP